MSAHPFLSLLTSATLRRAALCAAVLLVLGLIPGSPSPVAASGCSGQCLNPHPGDFKSWYGESSGCRVEVWRQWPDGCLHRQWYDKCTGTFDTDAQGNPQVTWTCCVH